MATCFVAFAPAFDQPLAELMSQITDSSLSRAVLDFLRDASALQPFVTQWPPEDHYRQLFEKCHALATMPGQLPPARPETVVAAPVDSYPAVASGAQILPRWPFIGPSPSATNISPPNEMKDIGRAASVLPQSPLHTSPQHTDAEVLNLDNDVAASYSQILEAKLNQ
ncbi:hypothetical protein R3P38DRAFT_3351429 [Favolaschia claudopus]|uniref:Uncharacterized protein n=1 Tax=Favolaschia claudopus TaxID=2862362 RepID=A0AAW0C6S0_9AGAR